MNHALSAAGAEALERLAARRAIYAFDFDGTLSRIVDFPQHARLAASIRDALQQLAVRAPVVVISGRALSDLEPRIGVSTVRCVGNHGAEGIGLAEVHLERARSLCAAWRERIAQSLASAPLRHGIEVEDKSLTLAIHYRRSHNYAASRHAIEGAIGTLDPAPRVVEGKAVYNLIPAGLPDKGQALRQLMLEGGLTDALYVGDDDTDEDVFAVDDERLVTVRVGLSARSRAQYYLRDQPEVEALVRMLVGLATGASLSR